MTLRHHCQRVLELTNKARGRFVNADGELLDLSGGALAQTLIGLPALEGSTLSTVTPSGGFESAAKRDYESTLLARTYPDGGALWTSSGSDAIEAALWAVDVLRRERGMNPGHRHWVRRGGYHGNTWLTRALSTRAGKQSVPGVTVEIIDEHDVTAPYRPAPSLPSDHRESRIFQALPRASNEGSLREGDSLILESVPSTGHVFEYEPNALSALLAWCKARGIFTIIDEVAAGAFRHGRFSIVETLRQASPTAALPDAVVVGKGLTSGAYPLSVALLSEEVAAAVLRRKEKALSFTHGLSEAAATLALFVYHRQTGALSDSAEQRALLLAESTRRLTRIERESRGRFGIASTPTTIRLDLPAESSRALFTAMNARGLWCYVGQTSFPVPGSEARRSFFHVCPPFDLAAEETERALIAFEASVSEALAEKSAWTSYQST
ncbi:MAG TPA: aminotransferase class III-fold pyridoxal phosphate-dependent enzyme [Polyangiaceae bacterium]|nr:aminotransferase class III-fold pyridoxal phosphate-dependent enzyme [Polyangiaceae bacterium]